jgi:hypothetical protein
MCGVLSIFLNSRSNVELPLTHLQLAAGESVMLASQLSKNNHKTGFLLQNIFTGNECNWKAVHTSTVKVTTWNSLWLMLQFGPVGKQQHVEGSIKNQICLASTLGPHISHPSSVPTFFTKNTRVTKLCFPTCC